MYIIATFQHDLFVELAISKLIESGVPKDHILAVPLQQKAAKRRLFDTIHHADGYSSMDIASILCTVLMLLGAIYGYVLKWGPILWALIGAVTGFALGLLIKLIFFKVKVGAQPLRSEVVLIIHCKHVNKDLVEQILSEHTALAIADIQLERAALH